MAKKYIADIIESTSITGSLFGTASLATSASFALSAISASYALNATNALNATTASYSPNYLPLSGGGVVSGNVSFIGTASFAYTTQSIIEIGASTITLNTDNPAARFGGMVVVDSGSFGIDSTGSLLWDSQNNRWVYANPSGSSYSGGMLISGPRNNSGLGDEQGTLNNYITKGQGGDHITSSMIYEDNSGNVGIGNASPSASLDVNGTGRFIAASSTNLIIERTGNNGVFMGLKDSSGNFAYIGANNGDFLIQTPTGGYSTKLTITNSGAATFSSSVTTTFLNIGSSNGQMGSINSSNANGGYITWETSGVTIADIGTSQQIFGAGGNDTFGINARGARNLVFGSSNTERMRIFSSGNIFIGSSPSDAGFKLDVNGTGRFSGALVGTNAAFNQAGTTSLYLTNTLISGGSTSGTTGLYMGDAGSGVNVITREKVTANTAYTSIYSEYGYNVAVKAAHFFNGSAAFFGNLSNSLDGTFGANRVSNDAGTTLVNIQGSSSSSTSAQLNLTQVWNGLSYPIVLRNIFNPAAGAASSIFTLSTTQFNGSVPETTERLSIDGNSGIAIFNGIIRSIPVYNNTTATAANLVVSAGGTFERSTSSLKYKKEVRDYDKGLETLLKIRPVYYKGKSESDGDKQFAGLIAEEIHELGLNEFVQYAEDGTPDALAYTHMVALLIASIKEQQAQIKELQDELVLLKNK
jgi:hypothetical protein